MKLAMAQISAVRGNFILDPNTLTTEDDYVTSVVSDASQDDQANYYIDVAETAKFAHRSAYIIRQIKRPEEVRLLRQIYGRQFALVSAYGSENERLNILGDKIRHDGNNSGRESREYYLAKKLIELDADEHDDKFGQHTRDAFHLADVVIDGINIETMRSNITRFVDALFGANDIAPSKSEFGMAAAHLASLRSSDLSRQVGAAIFSNDGSLLVQGCNEVPKAFGGTYWDEELPDYRDIKVGRDSNDILKIDVLRDLVDKLRTNGLLSASLLKAGSSSKIVNILIGRSNPPEGLEVAGSALKTSKVLDLTEYGRVVHAEMNAICDSARSGTALRGSILFTTTFPCHNCTKHILAAGISEVVFLEPYPKSKAKELHSNEISIEGRENGKVNFRPFLGITPFRYKELFLKSKRKDKGHAVRWQHGSPAPMVDLYTLDYLRLEEFIMFKNGEEISADDLPDTAENQNMIEDSRQPKPDDATGSYNPDGP